ncbi:tetratricopeptide repeat protein [Priestia aryabhattai]|uniref:tetratricopeptide repeat protein n=1 Tax=Priestia aryabhattai TaxID=412384 RepID=UPI001C8DD267|nr:tetratricopeptide repeat protein [Priestia aryabhattai]MBY0004049.1 tetratricopeptide repeat protein [Priestia aryabhattai]MBY0046666.1 tetratricopeptide repeat protein [Priestia aryabhattai]
MNNKLDKALALRKNGNHKESNELLSELVKEFPDDALYNYQCAWSFDILGEEEKAVPFYENAIKIGLPSKEDMEGAVLGLGSTYRALGEYEKSKKTFLKGIELFPDNHVIKVFYSMTLYNLKEHSKAMELILKCLLNTTSDNEILSYKKALNFYSDKLDQTWK